MIGLCPRSDVSERSETQQKKMKMCLLGVSFDTGNMGVSALAESSIKVIINRWPGAEVTLVGTGDKDGDHCLKIAGQEVRAREIRMRFCKNLFLQSHFCVLLVNALLLKLLPWSRFKRLLSSINPSVKLLVETDKVFDLTGGDSFSDIYGMRRFLLYGFLQKWLVTLFGKELILLPQTYGPFQRSISRKMARCVLRRASAVYVRDRSGVEYVKELLGGRNGDAKARFAPDVAFVLDPRRPERIDVGALDAARRKESVVVGLNISALLFNGGYTRKNMFNLKVDYSELVYDMVDSLMKDSNVLILLVPHVFTPDRPVEDDPTACAKVFEHLEKTYPGRIFLVRGGYDHAGIKYIIGMCDFFIGSRMHACIAALSQCIPAVGLAYSKKFRGVFESVGLGDCVADAYRCEKGELLSTVEAAFENRERTAKKLKEAIPGVQADILSVLHI